MALLVLLAGFSLSAAFDISRFSSISSPGAFPMVCAAAMAITAVLSLGGSLRKSPAEASEQSGLRQFVTHVMPVRLVLFVAALVGYMLLLERLGFLVSSYIYLLLSMRILGSRRLGMNAVLSVLVLAGVFLVFRTAFSVVLPAGSLLGPYTPELLK
ncbi:MAG: Tripartite tricarboxylate transporter TctB family protein [Ramlibacter sp.]|nr:Tripartite tricarboxylate transporter TctB family protein [Ramlibacter sp.]